MHKMSKWIVLALCPLICLGAKFLVVPPTELESHLLVFESIASALESKGHKVIFALNKGHEWAGSDTFRVQRYGSAPEGPRFLQKKLGSILAGHKASLDLRSVARQSMANCDRMLGSNDFLSSLRAERIDLLLVDPSEMCGFALAHFITAPSAVVSPGHWYPSEIGAPSPVSWVPEFESGTTDRPGFLQRLWNALVYVRGQVDLHWGIFPELEAVMARHAGNNGSSQLKSMSDLITQTGFFLLNLDISLDFPRPSLPNVEFMGGILTRPARTLPQEWRSWVEGAKAGVALASFGTGVLKLPRPLAEKMASAFSRLPQRVIWSYNGKTPTSLGNNTRIKNWVPQNDFLGHPNVLVFVSDCSLNGVYEAIFHGVPMVCIPVFGDQHDVATRVQAKGFGIYLDFAALTEDSLLSAIRTILDQHSYKETAVRLSKILGDQREHPLNRTVYWLEYLLRHRGALHLRPASYDIPAYQYYLLDVLACVVLVPLAVLCLLHRVAAKQRPRPASVSPYAAANRGLHPSAQLLNGHTTRARRAE
ncbi:hypothetical protein MATL_G00186450 [Megalops atlanticus]|uniref:UDP-glycosyltransferase n=1 Tax=Megalops atlanticus TaxID=7932 RepID=A0A9D3PQ99_MEGAT|nr:hypothetical protein MATL_G00186450 [Megalops atlanticus]